MNNDVKAADCAASLLPSQEGEAYNAPIMDVTSFSHWKKFHTSLLNFLIPILD